MIFVLIALCVVIVVCVVILTRECTPQLNPRCVATYNFVKALVEKETPDIHETVSLGYLHVYTLVFKEVRINLEYNDIRHQWSMEIWCYAAQQHLFWHTCTDTQPFAAMNVLIQKYRLNDRLEKSLARKEAIETTQKQNANDVIKRILGK